jgi:formate/nitrite transporter FocA (FNT family)
VLAGALLTLLSYMLAAADSTIARMVAAYMVGFFLAIGPFDHVVVSALHLLFVVWLSNEVGYGDLEIVTLSTVGLAGGLLLVTLTHTAQVKARRSPGGSTIREQARRPRSDRRSARRGAPPLAR